MALRALRSSIAVLRSLPRGRKVVSCFGRYAVVEGVFAFVAFSCSLFRIRERSERAQSKHEAKEPRAADGTVSSWLRGRGPLSRDHPLEALADGCLASLKQFLATSDFCVLACACLVEGIHGCQPVTENLVSWLRLESEAVGFSNDDWSKMSEGSGKHEFQAEVSFWRDFNIKPLFTDKQDFSSRRGSV